MIETTSTADSPEWPAIVETSTRAVLEWLPADALERLAVYCSPAYVRRARLRERAAAIRELAMHYSAASGRALAGRMAEDLARYRAAGRHRDPPPADPRRLLLHRVVELSGGRAPGWRTVFVALAGLDGVQRTTPNSAHDLREDRDSSQSR